MSVSAWLIRSATPLSPTSSRFRITSWIPSGSRTETASFTALRTVVISQRIGVTQQLPPGPVEVLAQRNSKEFASEVPNVVFERQPVGGPERLWLLVYDERGPGDFPPLRTQPVRPTNLPAISAATRLIGREREHQELVDLICAGDVRLITLVGPGGVGKTRLALELAHAAKPRFSDAAAWVELAAVGRVEHVPSTVAQALAVTPLSGKTPEQALLRRLETEHVLLVIDNFEHVLEAAPLVAELLAHCAALTVLATSREALDLAAEHVYPVAPLALPAGDERLTAARVEASPAGELFLAAARRRNPSLRVGDGSARAI